MANEHRHATSYTCSVCNKSFQLTYMYACYHGQYLCKKCHKRACVQENTSSPCNLPFKHGGGGGGGHGEDDQGRTRIMFPNPGRYTRKTIDTRSSLMSLATIYKPSLVNLTTSSKKPIQCPHHNCNKTIAVSALGTHYKHEHKHVACVLTHVETRNGLEFQFGHLLGDVTNLCLVLINLDDGLDASISTGDAPIEPKRSSFSRSSQLQTPVKPFFLAIAAKVSCGPADPSSEDDQDDEEPTGKFGRNDRIIFYVTSNVVTSYTYTLAVSTHDQSIRSKYYGPLPSLNEDFRRLYAEGKGLILNHCQINGMSDNGTRPVSVDIIVHERDADCYDSDRD